MRQIKKCKAQGRAKGFTGCGNQVPAKSRKYGLCRDCFKRWATSTPEGAKYLQGVALKAKKKVSKEQRKKERQKKIEQTDYRIKLQQSINEIVRLIDIGLPCLAKGIHPNQIHAGHIFSRGAESQMRYNLHNIHRQSAQSNHLQNEDGLLREKLKEEYGEDYYNFLSSMRRIEPLKYDNHQYREWHKQARKIIKNLRSRGQRFNREQRIELRNEINKALGIYPMEWCIYKGEKL